jgi:hypothetical protein
MPKFGLIEFFLLVFLVFIEYLNILKIKYHRRQLRSGKGIKYNQTVGLISSYIVFIGVIITAVVFFAQYF